MRRQPHIAHARIFIVNKQFPFFFRHVIFEWMFVFVLCLIFDFRAMYLNGGAALLVMCTHFTEVRPESTESPNQPSWIHWMNNKKPIPLSVCVVPSL